MYKHRKKPAFIFILVLLVSAIIVASAQLLAMRRSEKTHADAIDRLAAETTKHSPSTPDVPEPEEAPATLINADFVTLREVNPDIKGWIRIAGTSIDFPVLQSGDNQSYLYRSFDGGYSQSGSIFLDYRVSLADSKILLMYGHNMGWGKTIMFSELINYTDKSYCEEHPEIRFAWDDGTANGNENVWTVFAVCAVNTAYAENRTGYFSMDFSTAGEYESYIDALVAHSLYSIDTGRKEYPERVIALATCLKPGRNSPERLVIYAGQSSKEEQ